MTDAWVVANSLMMYFYNVGPREAVSELFGIEQHPEYVSEKTRLFWSPTTFWGALDHKRQRALIGMAIVRYGECSEECAKKCEGA